MPLKENVRVQGRWNSAIRLFAHGDQHTPQACENHLHPRHYTTLLGFHIVENKQRDKGENLREPRGFQWLESLDFQLVGRVVSIP